MGKIYGAAIQGRCPKLLWRLEEISASVRWQRIATTYYEGAKAMPFVCTPNTPWKPEHGTPVQHSRVVEVGEQEDGYPGGDIVTKRCLNCGHEWRQELPQ